VAERAHRCERECDRVTMARKLEFRGAGGMKRMPSLSTGFDSQLLALLAFWGVVVVALVFCKTTCEPGEPEPRDPAE
jgi:hypothetical protein